MFLPPSGQTCPVTFLEVGGMRRWSQMCWQGLGKANQTQNFFSYFDVQIFSDPIFSHWCLEIFRGNANFCKWTGVLVAANLFVLPCASENHNWEKVLGHQAYFEEKWRLQHDWGVMRKILPKKAIFARSHAPKKSCTFVNRQRRSLYAGLMLSFSKLGSWLKSLLTILIRLPAGAVSSAWLRWMSILCWWVSCTECLVGILITIGASTAKRCPSSLMPSFEGQVETEKIKDKICFCFKTPDHHFRLSVNFLITASTSFALSWTSHHLCSIFPLCICWLFPA